MENVATQIAHTFVALAEAVIESIEVVGIGLLTGGPAFVIGLQLIRTGTRQETR